MDIKKNDESAQKKFRKAKIATLETLYKVFNTSSRTTIFRRLKSLGYYSSLSHRGKYYSLAEIPKFDEHGLWFYKGVGFSKHRNLKETIVELVENSDRGVIHRELKALLKSDVLDTLKDLTEQSRIYRETYDGQFLYASNKKTRRANQISARRKFSLGRLFPSDADAVLLLVEVIKAPSSTFKDLAKSVRSKGVKIAEAAIENLLTYHDLLKKTPDSKR